MLFWFKKKLFWKLFTRWAGEITMFLKKRKERQHPELNCLNLISIQM